MDKCLEQFKAGKNAEAEDGKPNRLQTWLAMIADVNDGQVSVAAQLDGALKEMRAEAHGMAQDKEVQNMLIQEKYERMDWATYGYEQRTEGREEGREDTLIDQIGKKIRKGKILERIADELEESVEFVRPFYEAIQKAAPGYDTQEIRRILHAQAG